MNDLDIYVYVITALLPLSACLVVLQVNPYHALIIRGILGAIAAMVYAILGAGDVALTEALVGTLLAITLYAVAVRSSLVMRLGMLKEGSDDRLLQQQIERLRAILSKRHLRLEILSYTDPQVLYQALIDKEIHATCSPQLQPALVRETKTQPYQIITRIERLYEIVKSELSPSETILNYVNMPEEKQK